MEAKENKLYFSNTSPPEDFPDYSTYDIVAIQKSINELYAKILASQEEMCKVKLFAVNPNDYALWKGNISEQDHKEFYNKFDKILK